MPTNADWVRVVCRSDPYKKFAAKYPIDAGKVTKSLESGKQPPEPGSLFARGLVRAIFAKPYMPGVADHVRTTMSSAPYKEWANYQSASGIYPHRTDHNKLLKRLEGKPTTAPSSLLAQGLGGLLYQPVEPPPAPDDPPPGPGAPVWPPDKGTLSPLLAQDIVFTRSLSSFYGTLRAAARQKGWAGLAIQFDHAYYTDENKAELGRIRSRLVAEGWTIGGWSVYGYDNVDPYQDGLRHSRMAIDFDLKFWIANGEAWAESANIGKSNAWIDGWIAGGSGGGIPVAVSCLSSNTDGWAREFDYAAFIDRLPGSGVFPQVYGATYDSYTVHNALETLKRGKVPKNRVGLTFDVINGQGPFGDYVTWTGPRQLWTGDDSTVETFAGLG